MGWWSNYLRVIYSYLFITALSLSLSLTHIHSLSAHNAHAQCGAWLVADSTIHITVAVSRQTSHHMLKFTYTVRKACCNICPTAYPSSIPNLSIYRLAIYIQSLQKATVSWNRPSATPLLLLLYSCTVLLLKIRKWITQWRSGAVPAPQQHFLVVTT